MSENENKQKTFQNSWLHLPKFKSWLEPVANNAKAHCRACKVFILKFFLCTPSVAKVCATSSNHDKEVKYAELKLASYAAEHNLALQAFEHLIQLLLKIFPDSKTAASVNI